MLFLFLDIFVDGHEQAERESLEWNPSISKKLGLTRQCGVGGEEGSGDSISAVKHISH